MDRAITSALDIWQRFTFTRYLAASIVALAFDMATFSSLVAMQFDATWASAVGYCIGIVVHWLVSANMVFVGKTREGGSLRLQQALFAGSALAGLGITVGVVEILSDAGVHAIAAKAVAVGISFAAVYALRKWGVFR